MKSHKSAQQRTVGLSWFAYVRLSQDIPNLPDDIDLEHVVNLYVDLGPDGYYYNVAALDTGEHVYVTL